MAYYKLIKLTPETYNYIRSIINRDYGENVSTPYGLYLITHNYNRARQRGKI